ncbi:Os08g0484633, partial [Oryza sativa Japonica Group]
NPQFGKEGCTEVQEKELRPRNSLHIQQILLNLKLHTWISNLITAGNLPFTSPLSIIIESSTKLWLTSNISVA